jgi:hypothetical protein
MTKIDKIGVALPGMAPGFDAKNSSKIQKSKKNEAHALDSPKERKGLTITKVAHAAFAIIAAASAVTLGAAIAACVIAPTVAAGVVIAVSAAAIAVLTGLAVVHLLRKVENLPEPLKRLVDAIHANANEMFAFIALGVLFPLALFDFDPKFKKGEVAEQTPILCVHGYLHNNSGWGYLKSRLKSAGQGPVYTISLSKNPFKSVDDYAEAVAKKVEEIKKATGRNDIILIGHSMGGLVTSHYATQIAAGKGTQVTDVITLGSPLQGTKVANVGLGRDARQMEYRGGTGNGYLNNLNERVEKCTGTNFFPIRSKSDWVIIPNAAAEFKADGEHIKPTKVIPHLGHTGYFFSDDVADTINDYLDERKAKQAV